MSNEMQRGALLIGGPCDGQMHEWKNEPKMVFDSLKLSSPFDYLRNDYCSKEHVEIEKVVYRRESIQFAGRDVWFYVFDELDDKKVLDLLFGSYKPLSQNMIGGACGH